MGERTSYAPGTFSWADLGTTDTEGAKAFYTQLFGWEAEDAPVTDAGPYTMLRLGGREVGALYERGADGGPPAWLSYVTVIDVDESAQRALALGATSVLDPVDAVDAGRMTVLQDPTGALFALWQPRNQIGARLVNDPGAMCLNQLNTTDPDVARRFYTELFGWRIESVGTDEQPYWGIFNGDALNGGMMPWPPEGRGPSHWLVYFTTADLDGSVDRIGRLGGSIVLPPMSIPGGRISVAADPQGATFALFEGRIDP